MQESLDPFSDEVRVQHCISEWRYAVAKRDNERLRRSTDTSGRAKEMCEHWWNPDGTGSSLPDDTLAICIHNRTGPILAKVGLGSDWEKCWMAATTSDAAMACKLPPGWELVDTNK
jgi:hypothetical protein